MGTPGDAVVEVTSPRPVEYAFDVFIIHAADDRDFVRGYLAPALNLPAQRVLVVDDLRLGAMIVSEIDRGISCSRFTVVVLSPAYLRDRWAVYGEQLAAHVSVEDVHVIPLRLADVKLPHRLEARIALDFTDPARWDVGAARLRSLLDTAEPVREHLPCPYPGMRPFTEHDAARFFGRAREIDDLIDRLEQRQREIYAIGPSGSGKSSLVHAGLMHVLGTGSSKLGCSFLVRTMRPGQRPADRLTTALEYDLAAPEVTVDRLLAGHSPASRTLVIIDQLEEIFTLADAAERRRFVATLRVLARDLRCHFLFVLRADFYGALMESELWPAGELSPINLAPLRGEALAQAIIEPAAQAGVYLERRLCDRLLAEAATEPGALPHVQETLRLLWETRRQRLLGLAEYEALGNAGRGLDAAIARQAEATMRAFTARQQAIARRVLLRLVVFGEGRADTRRQQAVRALQSATDEDPEFSQVLWQLVEDRLITVQRGKLADDAVVDLSHEALITAWPAFRDWIAQQRAEEQLRRRLEAKAAEWIEQGRGTACLLEPLTLSKAERWMQSAAAQDLGYGPDLPAFIAASKRELDRAQHRKRRETLQKILVLAFATLIAMTAWSKWRSARRDAEARRILEQDRALLVTHPMRVLHHLIAARSDEIESPALRNMLMHAAKAAPLLTLAHGCTIINNIVFSLDGTRLAMTCDNTARLWNAVTGVPLTRPLEHRGTVRTVDFSRDGTRVITTSDNTARVWDARTGAPVTPPLQHPDAIAAASFSRDGIRIITTSGDRRRRYGPPSFVERSLEEMADTADWSEPPLSDDPDITQEWDAATGKRITLPLEHPYAVVAAVFSLDVRRVVTISSRGTAQVWDISTGRPMPPLEYSVDVAAAAFSADGARLMTASTRGTARVWDVATGKRLTSLLEHHGIITAAAFSPDGTRVVTMSNENRARLWDGTHGSLPVSLEHEDLVTAAAFSADGARVVTASNDGTARVWDAATGKPVTPPLEHADHVTTAAFSPDGTRVVTASEDGTVRVWDATATTLEHRHFVMAAAFSPDGRRVVTASEDGTARVWSAMTGRPVTPPLEHRSCVTAAAFSPGGTRVVTASEDGTARVWDATTGDPVTPPLEHRSGVTVAAFSPDGMLSSQRAEMGRPSSGTLRAARRSSRRSCIIALSRQLRSPRTAPG